MHCTCGTLPFSASWLLKWHKILRKMIYSSPLSHLDRPILLQIWKNSSSCRSPYILYLEYIMNKRKLSFYQAVLNNPLTKTVTDLNESRSITSYLHLNWVSAFAEFNGNQWNISTFVQFSLRNLSSYTRKCVSNKNFQE